MNERIRELRVNRDKPLSQKEFAKILHIDQSTYSDYETGQINIPVDMLCKIADYYHVSVEYLIGRTNIKEPCHSCKYYKSYHKSK